MRVGRILPHAVSAALIGAAALLVLGVFLWPTPSKLGINQFNRARFVDMIERMAYRPFVTRALVPATIAGFRSLAPEPVQTSVSEWVERTPRVRRTFRTLEWEEREAFSYTVACLLLYASFAGFALLFAKLAMFTVPAIPRNATTLALLGCGALLALPPFFRYASYLYDPPQLLLFTGAYLCIARGRLVPFTALFLLATINKETSILLLPVLAWRLRGTLPARRLALVTCGLLLAYLFVRGALALAFHESPGRALYFFLYRHNVRRILEGWSFTSLVTAGAVAWLLTHAWGAKPRFLRGAFLLVFLPQAATTCIWGYVDEWRVYYEAYPVAAALAADSVLRLRRAGAGSEPFRDAPSATPSAPGPTTRE